MTRAVPGPGRSSPGRRRRALGIGALLSSALLTDACVLEPRWLEVTRPSLAASHGDVTVAVVSDLHTRGLGFLERQLVDRLRDAKPDIIAVTGDVVDDGHLDAARPVIAALVSTAPRLGVWVVSGNWEHWRPPGIDADAFYTSLGAHLLDDRGAPLEADLWIAGVDWQSPPAAALSSVPRGARLVLLTHAPAGFEGLAALARARDNRLLVLAGHTHGGQVRLPFAGALWLPPGSGPYEAGRYALGDAAMYVSRGLGTSVLPVRFACRPELPLVRWR